eukprot:TRINITY_DN5303_c0_g2_i2.p1 TRINITY_DN5303_c0_g2~~TRINITY_DN5303_c0_g2_i2.p1  ORF type:complete len:132 (-),score=6.31 TRINITY_DN5303_c0_g2_i2:606-1001(-)
MDQLSDEYLVFRSCISHIQIVDINSNFSKILFIDSPHEINIFWNKVFINDSLRVSIQDNQHSWCHPSFCDITRQWSQPKNVPQVHFIIINYMRSSLAIAHIIREHFLFICWVFFCVESVKLESTDLKVVCY